MEHVLFAKFTFEIRGQAQIARRGSHMTCIQGRRSHRIIGWDIKEDWGLGDRILPVGSMGRAPVGGLGKSPRSWSFFCETTHNICIKIQQNSCCCYWI